MRKEGGERSMNLLNNDRHHLSALCDFYLSDRLRVRTELVLVRILLSHCDGLDILRPSLDNGADSPPAKFAPARCKTLAHRPSFDKTLPIVPNLAPHAVWRHRPTEGAPMRAYTKFSQQQRLQLKPRSVVPLRFNSKLHYASFDTEPQGVSETRDLPDLR